ncbi:lipoteichoic acid synthase LtaS type IIa [Agrilactobacillus composti DSM 18527 = JCM 14202]|nr:lipoteichoic acid synthase LtaS type IIa [Agrilactobacillus composti DSM 18527 = JCM 14202]
MPGLKGGINHTYGGEIDVLPTLLNLTGIKDTDSIQFGQDLLSPQRNQTVAFRNGDFVSPDYTKVGSTYYNTKSGEIIKDPAAPVKTTLDELTNHVATELSLSDSVITGDLLRFYEPAWFKKVDKTKYSYKKSKALKTLKADANKDTLEKQDGKSTEDLYKTDAPELK